MSVLSGSLPYRESKVQAVYFLAFLDYDLDLPLCLIFKVANQHLPCYCPDCDRVAIVAEVYGT